MVRKALIQQRTSSIKMFPAASQGLIANSNLALNPSKSLNGAFFLENYFPTAQGMEIRKGTNVYATLADESLSVSALFDYNNGNNQRLFAADENQIYDITSISSPYNYFLSTGDDDIVDDLGNNIGQLSTEGLNVVTGQTGGDWIFTQFATTGGVFLVGVNGSDDMKLYDGSKWFSIDQYGIYTLNFDAKTADFAVGQTVTGETTNIIRFDAQVTAFIPGYTLTGLTSGATGHITGVESDGTVGTLYLSSVTGTFQNNETIRSAPDGMGAFGQASADGTQQPYSVTGYIAYIEGTGATGTLYLADVMGLFHDNELITSSTGSATVNGNPTPYYTGIEGIDTALLSYVWSYKNRLFFLEKDSMNVWYLPVDQIGGAITKFPMGGEFSEGGKLLMGSSWSLGTSGDGGLSEQCIFLTDEGQVSVYQGLSPDPDQGWSKVGTYKIGKPLGPLAWIRAGGDIINATDIGSIPLSQALNTDLAALSPAAVSYAIETEWNSIVQARRSLPWNCVVWPERQMVIVAPQTIAGQSPMVFAANARTGAWTKFTNWDVTCLCVFKGRLFYGSKAGKVVEAYVTGLDQGSTFTASYVPLFNDFGNPAGLKIPKVARAVTRGAVDVNVQLSIMSDYVVTMPSAPNAAPLSTDSVWGGAIWGQSTWGGSKEKKIQQHWDSVSGLGYYLSPCLQITSGSIVELDTEIIRTEVTFESADIVT